MDRPIACGDQPVEPPKNGWHALFTQAPLPSRCALFGPNQSEWRPANRPRLCNRVEPGTSCSSPEISWGDVSATGLQGEHRHPGKTRAAGRQPVFPICRALVSIVKMSCYPTTCRVFATYTGPQWERKRNQQYHRAHKGSDYGSRSFHTRMHREARLLAPQSLATRT